MLDDLWASRLLMSQWPNSTGAQRMFEATRFSISPATASTSGASKKAERAFMQLAHFSQSKMEAPLPTGALLTMETTKEQSRYNFPVFLRYDNRHLALGSASRRAL